MVPIPVTSSRDWVKLPRHLSQSNEIEGDAQKGAGLPPSPKLSLYRLYLSSLSQPFLLPSECQLTPCTGLAWAGQGALSQPEGGWDIDVGAFLFISTTVRASASPTELQVLLVSSSMTMLRPTLVFSGHNNTNRIIEVRR